MKALVAPFVFPISQPPIKDGALVLEEERIVAVGDAKELLAKYKDVKKDQIEKFPGSVLMPGLVNAHTHLEFSGLRDSTTAHSPFTDWVREVTQGQVSLSLEEKSEAAQAAVQRLIAGGSTTIADHRHQTSRWLSVAGPLRQVIFWEVLGANATRAREGLTSARRSAEELGGNPSPHSLYAVHPETLDEMALRQSHDPILQSVHLLESSDEENFFRQQSGPLANYVLERGGELSLPFSSPVQWLATRGLLNRHLLLVHCNYLNDAEIQLLQETGAGVIHCPGSHLFFGHKRFPFEGLQKRGIPVALGTDSLASNEDLSMFQEMRLFKENFQGLGAEDILEMVTRTSARLLQKDHEIGTLEKGKKADVIAVPLTNPSLGPYENVLLADEVSFSMIDGKIISPPVLPLP